MKLTKKHILPLTNITFASIATILVIWAWIKFMTATVDTMFAGLFIIALVVITIYYLSLLFMTIKMLNIERQKTQMQNVFLLLFITIPIVLIIIRTI